VDSAARADATAIAARVGGDEFAVLLTGFSMAGDALTRARSLIAKLAEPIELGGLRLEVGATAGVAVAAERDVSVDELLRRADVAMSQAKDENQPIALYVRDRDTADADRLSLSADLARAVSDRQFVIAFQPIVDLATGDVISMEALARWYHPQRGHLAPLRFLGAIERSGLLAPFTAHVLDQSLAGAREWRDAGFKLPVAVNVSPRSLLDPAFPDSIPAALALHGLPPEALTIELTETLTLSQLEVVDDVLHALRDLGVSLALDDFGTGYSSLATIARVPVHELKIDRTFVAGMTGTTESAIVRSTIELGRSLNLLVVAEGIENDEQRERLWSLGCPAGQGHLFARPMNAAHLIARLHRGHDGVPGRLVAPLHASGDVIRLPAPRRSTASRSTTKTAKTPPPATRSTGAGSAAAQLAAPPSSASPSSAPEPRPRRRSGRGDSRTASTE
jgi:predicted signal transduction protein with EAL and GGDEF domain